MANETDEAVASQDPVAPETKTIARIPVHLAVEMVPTFSHTHFSDVKAFHQKFGLLVHEQPVHLTKRKLGERIQFLKEELDEFAEASGYSLTKRLGIYEPDSGFEQDLAQQADALIDLVYVAIGTAVQLGLPWQELWDDVQRANMSKVRGETKRGHKVDVTKPEGWVGPMTEQILNRHGYNRADYMDFDGAIAEDTCHDDQ
jgi:predicted HAD superfamily Cof-like phosphohydrolase